MDSLRPLISDALQDLTMVSPRTIHLVFVLVIACGCWVVVARSHPPVLPWLALAAASLVWLRVDQREEGRVLVVLSVSHGLTQADLLVPVVAGAAVLLRSIRLGVSGYRRRRTQSIK